jgi:hypothetical protein
MKFSFKMGRFALFLVFAACKHKPPHSNAYIVIAQTTYGFADRKKNYQVNAFLDSNQLERYEKVRINQEILLHRFRPQKGNSNQYVNVDTTHATGAYDKLFGKTVSIELLRYPQNAPMEKVIAADSMSCYVPMPLNLTIDAKDTTRAQKWMVSKSVPLHWTPDLNHSFLLVTVSFYPKDVINFRHRTAKKVRKYHKVPDNGHFIIPADDFKEIPVGGEFEIKVERERISVGRSDKNGLGAIEILGIASVRLRGTPSSACDDCLEINK